MPEGVYRLTHLNPASSYHLSIRVDYPNAFDRARGAEDGRANLGGDIYIHGKAVSIGCLAIGDDNIEELFTLVADTGLANARIVLAPGRSVDVPAGAPPWTRGPLPHDRARARDAPGLTMRDGPLRAAVKWVARLRFAADLRRRARAAPATGRALARARGGMPPLRALLRGALHPRQRRWSGICAPRARPSSGGSAW